MSFLVLSGCGAAPTEPGTYTEKVPGHSILPVSVRVDDSLHSELVDQRVFEPRSAVKSGRADIDRMLVKW